MNFTDTNIFIKSTVIMECYSRYGIWNNSCEAQHLSWFIFSLTKYLLQNFLSLGIMLKSFQFHSWKSRRVHRSWINKYFVRLIQFDKENITKWVSMEITFHQWSTHILNLEPGIVLRENLCTLLVIYLKPLTSHNAQHWQCINSGNLLTISLLRYVWPEKPEGSMLEPQALILFFNLVNLINSINITEYTFIMMTFNYMFHFHMKTQTMVLNLEEYRSNCSTIFLQV